MALAWTYATLLQALLDWPVEDENSEEYLRNVPNLIGLGELRLVRDLNLSIFDVVDESLLLDEGERLVTKPTTLVATRALRIGQVISSAAEQPADADSICTSQIVPRTDGAMALDGAAVAGGSVTFTVARRVTVNELLASEGGLVITITGTDRNGFPCSEEVVSLGGGRTAFSLELYLTVTAVSARGGDGQRRIQVGGAVARGGVVIGRTWPLELRSKEFCQEYAPDRREVSIPVYFNEHSDTAWEIVDSADRDYAVICHHVARPQGLSSLTPNASTWLSQTVPDALFAACLMEAEHYLKADDRYADYKSKYEGEHLPAARLELRNSIRLGDRGPFSLMPQGV